MTTITNRPGFSPVRPTITADVTTVRANINVNVNVNINIGSGFVDGPPVSIPPDRNCWKTFPLPAPEQSSPPAGKGLSKAPEFGPNAVKTAGGYVIVPEGKDAAWSIYAPGQKPGEKPNTRIWGDPHVQEADGTKWDFTKNSNFKLPDGTNISCKTTAQEGYSVSASLDITNGADRVQITGIEKNKPSLGPITHDGYEARAQLTNRDTFILGGDKSNVKWFRERDGKLDGEIVGAAMITKDGKKYYEQNVNASSQYVVDPSLQPRIGSEAWGNKLRSEAVDYARNKYGAGSIGAELTAVGAQVDHQQNTWSARFSRFFDQIQAMQRLFSFFGAGEGLQRRGLSW